MIKGILKLSVVGVVCLLSCGQSDETTESTSYVEETESEVVLLDSAKYEIMETNHYPAAENYHVLLKDTTTNADSLQSFVDKFRRQYCNIQCNISLYDNESVKPFLTKYPLQDDEYLQVADHLVATSDFGVNEVFLYPYQDLKYKELGGKNWKKKPIE